MQYYSTSDLAKMFNVTNGAIRYWIRVRGLSAIHLPGGKFQVTQKALLNYLMSNGTTEEDAKAFVNAD